jgi:ribonuclease Z
MGSVRVTFLGTGASMSVHRAHTAIVLDCADGTRLLLDTSSGNSVLRQGAALGMPADGFEQVLLTHHHADHMGGLPFIQNYRTFIEPDGSPLRVYGTEEALATVRRYCVATRPLAIRVDQEGAWTFSGRRVIRWDPTEPGQRIGLGDTTWASPFPADHISGAVGWRVESDGLAVVFSGDTRSNAELVEAAKGASLLIHEALSTESDSHDAHLRGHAAGRAAALAGVAHLVITHIATPFHFDPQPLADDARRFFDGPITVARDLYQMTVDGG